LIDVDFKLAPIIPININKKKSWLMSIKKHRLYWQITLNNIGFP